MFLRPAFKILTPFTLWPVWPGLLVSLVGLNGNRCSLLFYRQNKAQAAAGQVRRLRC